MCAWRKKKGRPEFILLPQSRSGLLRSGAKNWGKIDALFEKIEKARAAGMNVHADRYPYIHSSTTLRMVVPPPFDVVDTATLNAKLRDSAE